MRQWCNKRTVETPTWENIQQDFESWKKSLLSKYEEGSDQEQLSKKNASILGTKSKDKLYAYNKIWAKIDILVYASCSKQ